MPRVRVRLVALLAVGVLTAAAAGAAQASATPVVTAIKSQDRVIRHSAAYRSLKHIRTSTAAEARKLIREFEALQPKVEHAATVVSHAAAVGARQRRGKRDWVTGARELARGIGQLDAGLLDVEHGRASAGKAILLRADRTLGMANLIGDRGDRLLGLPTTD